MLLGSRRWALALCFLTWLPSTVTADSYFFPNNTFYPYKTVNTACSTALQASVNCSVDLLTYAYADTFYPLGNATYQKSLCSPSCGTALSSYINTVIGACAGQQPFEGLPATYYGNFAQSYVYPRSLFLPLLQPVSQRSLPFLVFPDQLILTSSSLEHGT